MNMVTTFVIKNQFIYIDLQNKTNLLVIGFNSNIFRYYFFKIIINQLFYRG